MNLSFQLAEFFRVNSETMGRARPDTVTPTFLIHTGVVGDIIVSHVPQNLLDGHDIGVEVQLEGG